MRKLVQKLGQAVSVFDMRDAFVFGGLGLIGYGIAQVYPPAAYIVVGVVLFWLGARRPAA
jgi:hypothetical protein